MRPHPRASAEPCPLINSLISSLIYRYMTHPKTSVSGPIDWEALPTEELPTTIARRRRVKQKERFLKGPIALHLLLQAARLPGAALSTYLTTRHRADLRQCKTVTLPWAYLREWGIGPDAYRRALIMLSAAGLIAVETHIGRATRITLKDRSPSPWN